ncbi:MAG: hypothetical protein HND57_16230 [Planctomycetes bacterium]|nr:hypothetical protein [Planctomycetota bacterium]
MSSFASASANLLKRLIHRRRQSDSSSPADTAHGTDYAAPGLASTAADVSQDELDTIKPSPGHPAALDGMSATAYLDACLCTDGVLGCSFPASAGARAFAKQQGLRSNANAFDHPLLHIETLDPRGTLSAALGLSLSGQRASCALSGTDLMAGGLDTLATAAGRNAPMVVSLACRAAAGHACAIGSGHEAWHAAASVANCIQLFANTVQEAADFALIARRVAEQALCPVIVGMDGEQTAIALQDLKLADDQQMLRRFVGQPADHITSPTVAQQMLFGEQRRRIPRWFDLERPMMLGSLQDRDLWALGSAARQVYSDQQIEPILTDAFKLFERFTGRSYHPVHTHRLRDASIVLVAQGSLVDTACALSDWLLRTRNLKVGVLGIRTLRPFPGALIAQHLNAVPTVLVLERIANTLADGDLPLTREIRTAIQKHAGHASRSQQHLAAIACGCGGRPIQAADLFALVEQANKNPESLTDSTHYLGLDFIRKQSKYPKRQALHDALRRRSDTDLSTIGITAHTGAASAGTVTPNVVDLRPAGTFSLAVCRPAGSRYEPIAGEAGALLHDLLQPALIRSRPGLSWQRFDQQCVDTVSILPDKQHGSKASGSGAGTLFDPGDDTPLDCAVVIHPAGSGTPWHAPQITKRLMEGARVILVTDDAAEASMPPLSAATAQVLLTKNITVYRATAGPSTSEAAPPAATILETSLAAITAALAEHESFKAVLSPDKACAARRESLSHERLDEPDIEARLAVFAAAMDSTSVAGIPDLTAATTLPTDADSGHSVPAIVGELSRPDAGVECVARFWGQAGQPLLRGETDELTADPYLATGTIPPLTAMFRDVSGARTTFLEFDPATCDGNGALWTSCPDGSVVPMVASARSLIDTGIRLAGEAGDTAATTLASIAGKLAARVNRIVKSATTADPAPTELGRLLTVAFDQVTEGTDPEDDRQKRLTAALDSVITQIGAIVVCRTPVFFDDAEKITSGSGELFSLIVNPDACKCPEVVANTCKGRGLKVVPQTPERLSRARKLWALWQKLPDTAGRNDRPCHRACCRRVAGCDSVIASLPVCHGSRRWG